MLLHKIHAESHEVASRLNNPFKYTPTPLIVAAQQEAISHLEELAMVDPEIRDEISRGKMMGVMIVRDTAGELHYMVAYSGCMAGRIEMEGFAPPIFGRGASSKLFKAGDKELAQIKKEIEKLEKSAKYRAAKASHEALLARIEAERNTLNANYKEAKARRKIERTESLRPLKELQLESQRQKGEMGRAEARFKDEIAESNAQIERFHTEIEALKARRKALSYTLQKSMFESYKVCNGRGEERSLYSIFDEAHHRLPPSGAGECAAPKLLHYALTHNLTPLSIGEFWVGGTPRGEVRHHSHFYGACISRCHPILSFMLQGVDVEPLEFSAAKSLRDELSVVYEDDALLLLNKPSGLLSVPGRSSAESVRSIVEERYPTLSGGVIVHRLDQDTSGLLLIAKTPEAHKALQRQFSERTLSKRYIALVDGVVAADQGEISLPLITNFEDRPRQMVDFERGKSAITTYEVLSRREDNTTLLALTPHTGRTHQLRVHCAVSEGLAAPIRGDKLYGGSPAERLMLHAESIRFQHPTTLKWLSFTEKIEF